ncbi:MAG: hypothetical protein U0670_05070 [Anaerolineae bacterium]
MRRISFVVLLLIALTACAPQRQAAVVIPTLARLPSEYRLEDAERVARDFLDRWQSGSLDGMYDLLSFNVQEATPRQEFDDLYAQDQRTMSLAA